MLKILIVGSSGEMGKRVERLIRKQEGMITVAGFDRTSSGSEKFPVFSEVSELKNVDFDMIIDFSAPKASLEILRVAKEMKKPMIVATTGFEKEEKELFIEASKEIPIFMSPNMSIEIALLSYISRKVYKQMSDADIEIIETHHRRKVDAPSGTAMYLGESIIDESNGKLKMCFSRNERREARPTNEIGMHSIRGGNVVGSHSIQFIDDDETFQITHIAHNRDIFARGAIRAARFMEFKEKGLYSVEDIVQI